MNNSYKKVRIDLGDDLVRLARTNRAAFGELRPCSAQRRKFRLRRKSGWRDLNSRLLRPERSALPG